MAQPTRRTQAARTAETRAALIEATVTLLHRYGYGGATLLQIAEDAGVTRGGLLHHFNSRAELMAAVLASVYDDEHQAYAELESQGFDGSLIEDWPEMLWQVLRRPGAFAVLEILQASRSDPELAALVGPAQKRIESASVAGMLQRLALDDPDETLAATRFFVWAIRGLTIAEMLATDPDEVARSVGFFKKLVTAAKHDL